MRHQRSIAGLVMSMVVCASAHAVTFNNVVTLGDSLLDDPDGGRSPVAAEHVADRLGVPLTKFAASGSTSADLINSGQHTQAAAQFGEGDLAMMWIGGNDFFGSPFEIAFGGDDFLAELEANADTAMSTLNGAGLDIAVFNLPDMSKVPGVISAVNAATVLTPFLRPAAFENIMEATIDWNNRLAALATTYSASVIDVFSIFDQLAANPSDFSLLGNDPILNADTGCQFCVFFDDFLLPDVHPSSFAQGFIANEAIAGINAAYDPAGLMPLEPLSIVEIAELADVVVGDFDGDQFVGPSDLAKWQSDYGGAGSDADGDGDSDGNDFLVWQQQYTGGPAAVAAATVPEPAAATLAALLMVIQFGWRPAKRRFVFAIAF